MTIYIERSPARGYTGHMTSTIIQRKKKGTVVEIANRVDHVIDLLARSYKRMQIHDDNVVKAWNMAQTSIDNYIKKAREEISRYSRQAKTEHLARSVLGLTFLYKLAIEDKDHRLALDIIKEQNRLMKLDDTYEKTQGDKPGESSPQAVRDMLDKIQIVNEPGV